MRNRGEFWPAVPDWQTALLEGPGVRIAPARGTVGIHVASGRIEAALLHLGGLEALGPRDTIGSERYALRLAPDRVLIVSSRVEALLSGWSQEGFAVSEMTEGMVLLDLTGAAAGDIMAEGTGYDFAARDPRPRESATLVFAGLRPAIARRPDGFRFHIERPLATALWTWLARAVADRAG